MLPSKEHLRIFTSLFKGREDVFAIRWDIKIPRAHLSPDLVSFLRDSLNFVNSEYIIKKKLGKNTFGTDVYFRMLEECDGYVFMPRANQHREFSGTNFYRTIFG